MISQLNYIIALLNCVRTVREIMGVYLMERRAARAYSEFRKHAVCIRKGCILLCCTASTPLVPAPLKAIISPNIMVNGVSILQIFHEIIRPTIIWNGCARVEAVLPTHAHYDFICFTCSRCSTTSATIFTQCSCPLHNRPCPTPPPPPRT